VSNKIQHLVFWSLKSFRVSVHTALMSSNAKSSGTDDRSGKNEEEPPIIVAYVLRENLVNVISSQRFYLKQMQWCVESINDFWQHIVHVRRGVMPNVVPMSLRFCISWLTGNDCTNWNAREVCGWLQRNAGNGAHQCTSLGAITTTVIE